MLAGVATADRIRTAGRLIGNWHALKIADGPCGAPVDCERLMASDMGERRRRPRRGSLQRPVSSRIYRAGFAGVVVALLVAAFTVGRPDPLPEPKLGPSFDEASAVQFASEFARLNPTRTPGSTGAVDADRWVTERLADYGLRAHRQAFRVNIAGL